MAVRVAGPVRAKTRDSVAPGHAVIDFCNATKVGNKRKVSSMSANSVLVNIRLLHHQIRTNRQYNLYYLC